MSRYRGNIPSWIRSFRQRMSIQDVLTGRKVIVTRSLTDPGGIRRSTDQFGRPDKRLDQIRFRILDPADLIRRKPLTSAENSDTIVENQPQPHDNL